MADNVDLSSLQSLTEADKDVLSKISKTIRKERAISRAHEARIDNVCLSYQIQIDALIRENKDLHETVKKSSTDSAWLDARINEARKQAHEQSKSELSKLKNDTVLTEARLKKTEVEKDGIEKALCTAREMAAVDATLIQRLREEINQLRESKERTVSESVEKHARNMQLIRLSKEADSKATQYEEDNTFLRAQVKRLTSELVQTRTQMDSMSASHSAAASAANKANSELSNNLAAANTRASKLTTELSNVERQIIDLQADFEREKADQRAQIENLSKLVEMHREATKDAEIRLAGYTELLGTLAKETKSAEDHVPRQAPSLDRHAEVLFKSLNEALDTKLQVLENERHELVRARATEARMATRHQTLIREAESAKAEAEEARRQMITLEAELDAEKDKVAHFHRQLMFTGSGRGLQSPGVMPMSEKQEGDFMSTPASGHARRTSVQTPSPFRKGVNLGNAEQALASMVEIRRRHEAILQSLTGNRGDYSEFMND